MEVIESNGNPTIIAIGLGPEEKLLESIREVIKAHKIRDGAVISGVGTLKRCHMHYVNTSTFPPENRYYFVEEPVEVGSISGLIADYEPHIHIAVGCRDQKTYVGHLEEGSVVLYLAEVMILRTDTCDMLRDSSNKWGIGLLKGRVPT